MGRGDTLANALVGAIVTIFVTPFLPFAPIFGGGVAGYLEGTNGARGVRVGALAGLIALVPLLLFLALIGNLFVFVFAPAGITSPGLTGLGLTVLLLVFLAALVYVVVLSTLGGWAGAYLRGTR